ncbi:BadF/BadG/BcrA/BcrD ATPase family protein [Micromonospora chalcea]|uniref:BadF/BadG/BcrA/BcrD ATPase family protein n=1 Tax=Micromonospora chalcea TaxID=1874 RepID=UPI0037BC9136
MSDQGDRIAVVDSGGTFCRVSIWVVGGSSESVMQLASYDLPSNAWPAVFDLAKTNHCSLAWIAAASHPDVGHSEFLDEVSSLRRSLPCFVSNDVVPLLFATPDVSATVVCSVGTGSSFMSIDCKGLIRRASGIEFILSDEGSAYDLGWRGLRAGARAADGRELRPTELAAIVPAFFGCTLEQLGRSLVTSRDVKSAVASFAPVVCDLASQGDLVARQAVADAVGECLLGIRAVSPDMVPNFSISVYGGLPNGSPYFAGVLRSSLLVEFAGCPVAISATNSHVIAKVAARFCHMLAADATWDVAVIRVSASGLAKLRS